jgi:hypothetical protein
LFAGLTDVSVLRPHLVLPRAMTEHDVALLEASGPSATPLVNRSVSDAHFRTLRESALAKTLLGADCFARFWLSDLRRLTLFLAVMGETPWLRSGTLGNFLIGLLAQRSQMSSARVAQLIDIAVSTGDFVRYRDPRDARLFVLEPSPEACCALEGLVGAFCASIATFLGRDDPLPRMSDEQRLLAYMLFVHAGLDLLRPLSMDDRATGSMAFFLVLLDLRLHSPVAAADFVRREAVRLRLTKVTIRNVLRRAEAEGWTWRQGRLVQLTSLAQPMIDSWLEMIEAKLSELFTMMEQLASPGATLPANWQPLLRGQPQAMIVALQARREA